MRGGETNEATIQQFLTTLNAKLDAYEVILAKQKYLAGNVSPCYLLRLGCIDIVWEGIHSRRSLPSPLRRDAGQDWLRHPGEWQENQR